MSRLGKVALVLPEHPPTIAHVDRGCGDLALGIATAAHGLPR
jgi:hypothetical protein